MERGSTGSMGYLKLSTDHGFGTKSRSFYRSPWYPRRKCQNIRHSLYVRPWIGAQLPVDTLPLVSYMQPEPQSYGKFPNTHGQTASFFKETGVCSYKSKHSHFLTLTQVQTKFAFIPDDGSATFVIDVTVGASLVRHLELLLIILPADQQYGDTEGAC